jgi:hypothetical protein
LHGEDAGCKIPWPLIHTFKINLLTPRPGHRRAIFEIYKQATTNVVSQSTLRPS